MIPNDPLYARQWHLHLLRMAEVWDIEMGEPDVVIAVIEAGFDVTHPDLKNRIVKTVNIGGSNEIMTAENPGTAAADELTDHGTHMLGLIGAEINNREGGVGMAPLCGLLPVKIANPCDDEALARGIRSAVDEGARVINLSNVSYYYLGKMGKPYQPRQSSPPRSDALWEACRYAGRHRVLICSIVGSNQGFRETVWPAAYHAGLNVTQGDSLGEGPAAFCASHAYADVMAPSGKRTRTQDADRPFNSQDPAAESGLLSTVAMSRGGYRTWSGGCMGTAVASGVAGLLFSRFPRATVDQARQVICNTARGEGWDARRGHGYINPLGIVRLARLESALALADPALARCQGDLKFEVTLDNQGALDARDTLLVLYAGHVDTDEARQLAHVNVPVARGLEKTRVAVSGFEVPADTRELCAVLDLKGQRSAGQRRKGVFALTAVLPLEARTP